MEKKLEEKLEEIMKFHSWNQKELAHHLKVAKSQVTRWLAGKQIPSGENYEKINSEYSKVCS